MYLLYLIGPFDEEDSSLQTPVTLVTLDGNGPSGMIIEVVVCIVVVGVVIVVVVGGGLEEVVVEVVVGLFVVVDVLVHA